MSLLVIKIEKQSGAGQIVAQVNGEDRASEIARDHVKGAGAYGKNAAGDLSNNTHTVMVVDKDVVVEAYRQL